jgi:hypothetical protein
MTCATGGKTASGGEPRVSAGLSLTPTSGPAVLKGFRCRLGRQVFEVEVVDPRDEAGLNAVA